MSFPFDPFAELNQLSKTAANNGIDYKDLAQTAYSVWHSSQNLPKQCHCPDADIAPWVDVAARACQIIDLPEDEQAALEISAKKLAKTLYNQYVLSVDKVPDWDLITESQKHAWEATGRHLANLIDSDGTPNFPELEERIIEWSKSRQLVLS